MVSVFRVTSAAQSMEEPRCRSAVDAADGVAARCTSRGRAAWPATGLESPHELASGTVADIVAGGERAGRVRLGWGLPYAQRGAGVAETTRERPRDVQRHSQGPRNDANERRSSCLRRSPARAACCYKHFCCNCETFPTTCARLGWQTSGRRATRL